MCMEESEKAALLEKAKKYEGRQLYVKAAEAYEKLGENAKAAEMYEAAGAYLKAEEVFEKLGKADDAARCKAKREEAANQKTWAEMQTDFQADRGNPY